MNIPTYNDLMNRDDIQFISEYGEYLYVLLPPTELYDNTIWKVHKETHEVVYMMFTEYLCSGICDKATYIRGSLWGEE